jgi:sensor domain CHASE-containing protein
MKSLPKLTLRDLLWLIVVVVLSVLLWKQNKEISDLHKQQDAARVEAEANRLVAEARQADLEAQIQQLIVQLKRLGAMSAQDSAPASGANP